MNFKVLAALGASLVVAACGGSGSGGLDLPEASSGFSSLPDDGEVQLEGTAVTLVNGGSIEDPGVAEATITIYQSQGSPAEVFVTAGSRPLYFDVGNDSVIASEGDLTVLVRNDASEGLRVLNPNTSKYEYQTYGPWYLSSLLVDKGGVEDGSGYLSAGFPTEPANLPSTGASYEGESTGVVYVEGGGIPRTTSSSVRMTTEDFTTISLVLEDTLVLEDPVDADTWVSRDELNLSFNSLDINGAGFSGSIENSNGLSGSAGGRFYGPAADEAGGVFSATGNGTTYFGAFGAAKQ